MCYVYYIIAHGSNAAYLLQWQPTTLFKGAAIVRTYESKGYLWIIHFMFLTVYEQFIANGEWMWPSL